MRRDDEALQRASDEMKRLYSAPTTLGAARAYDEIRWHILPAIAAEDPDLAEACRCAVEGIVKERVRRRYVPAT